MRRKQSVLKIPALRSRVASVSIAESARCIGLALLVAGCADDAEETPQPSPTATLAEAPLPVESPVAPPAKPADDPGPPPAGCGTLAKDKNGFFTRSSGKASYVGFVPTGYSGKPTRLVVGLHGCGDSAANFASWGISPAKTRKTQDFIGISVGGRDGACWDTAKDHDKVLAAIADVATCFYVHQQKVVLAGFSSGGYLAYRMGLSNAEKYAGILIENSALGGQSAEGTTWKINVAHVAHKDDNTIPIAKVRADWAKLEAAGIPLQKTETAGTHDGSSDDWSEILLPTSATWKTP